MWDRGSLEILWQDIRQAVRTLRKDPGFTLVALTAIIIGIGSNTCIFSVVDKVLLQPLPYGDPNRIVQLGRKFPAGVSFTASIPKYMIWCDNDVFSSMTLYDLEGPGFNIDTGDFPEQVKGAHVSADYFTVFAMAPVIGRSFNHAEDLPNGPRAALISENLWRSHFGSDAQILTRTISLNSLPYPIVGVIPSRFAAKPEAEVWIPLQADSHSINQGHYLQIAARLRSGVSIPQAQAAMHAVGERFRDRYPNYMDKTESIAVVPMRDSIVGNIGKTLYVLFGAVAFVLLIACANVANLLLARSGGRHRELAIRSALGASRWRVIRQLLTENLLLSAVGGFLGLILGVLGVRMLLLVIPGDIPRIDPAQLRMPFAFLDWRILIFTIGASILTGCLFGLIPALQISKPDVASTLNEAGTRSSTGRHQNFTSRTLVALEMGLALMLLISAALLIRTFSGLSSAETGFDSRHVYTVLTSVADNRYQTTEATARLTHQALQNIESIAGVESASTSLVIPATSSVGALAFDILGSAAVPSGQEHYGPEQWRTVSPHFFKVFHIPLLSGRVFTEHDDMGGAPTVIVSEAFARKYFANENPIGRTLDIGKGIGPTYADYAMREIVGVVGDTSETGLVGGKVPAMYIPQAQQPQGMTKIFNSSVPLAWEVRSSLDEKSLISAIAKAIREVDGRLPLGEVRPMGKILADSISRQKFNMHLLSIFATSALLLAAIGIYGVMSYSVQQRTKEIGVRMALGADKNVIIAMMLRQGLTPAFIGVGAGLTGAFGLTRLMEGLLYGVKPGDLISFFGVATILLIVAFVAVLIPARRAISLDPVAALRGE